MSAGYADRLKEYPNKGVCGLPEFYETKRSFRSKMKILRSLVEESNYIVIFTGAGISTSTGIPDFRGPHGIWTLEKQKQAKQKNRAPENTGRQAHEAPRSLGENDKCDKIRTNRGKRKRRDDGLGDHANRVAIEDTDQKSSKNIGNANTSSSSNKDDLFVRAIPSFTHRAITHLVESDSTNVMSDRDDGPDFADTQRSIVDKFKFVITQNVDGLHRRSGLSRQKHAILHGCIFTETCERCRTEYFRKFTIHTISFQKTGRVCSTVTVRQDDGVDSHCNGYLRDTLLDWEDPLPETDLNRAEEHCAKADLVICLGTSLRIEPAASLPRLAKQFVIVNLQATPYDDFATLLIHAKVDDVMRYLLFMTGEGIPSTGTSSDANGENIPPTDSFELYSPPIQWVWAPPSSTHENHVLKTV